EFKFERPNSSSSGRIHIISNYPNLILFLIAIKFYHGLTGTQVPCDAFLGRAKASLGSEFLAFSVFLRINLLTAEGK
ncbi:hypothetical protein, partial [Microcoleus sp. POL10_C6]|uniref:hypothetical protein n=1 Tax=Microcoleus sp. POL10_C6 TaxID=2818852 RepID=UPI002FD46749